jgi:glucan biosynthesis protein C
MTGTTTRLYHLDGMRAFLMLVGIPYHASLVFSGRPWFVNSDNSRYIFLALEQFLHVWRMPIFFILAGFFAALVISRKGDRVWMEDRVKRLGLPLVTGLLVINTLQIVLVRAQNGDLSAGTFFGSIANPQTWVGQLWFLVDLLVFAALFVAIRQVGPARRALESLSDVVARASFTLAGKTMLVAVVAGILFVVGYLWDQTGEQLRFPVQNFLLLGACFLFGTLIRPHTLAALTPKRWPAITVVAITASASVILVNRYTHGTERELLDGVIVAVASLLMGAALLAITSAWAGKPNRFIQWLVDASLIIYLLHHPLVIAYGALLSGIHPVLGFVLLVGLVFVTCAAIYEVLARFRVTRLLFNGSTRPLATFTGVLHPTKRVEVPETVGHNAGR